MSVVPFEAAVKQALLHENDLKWFPRWVKWYERFHRVREHKPLRVDRDSVIQFPADMKDWHEMTIANHESTRIRRRVDRNLRSQCHGSTGMGVFQIRVHR